MEQFQKIVIEAPPGISYVTSKGENGELIIRIVRKLPVELQVETEPPRSEK